MKKQLLTAFALFFFGNIMAQTFTNYTTIDGLLSNNVNCVDTDLNNHVWFGTQDGVSYFNGASWVSHSVTTDPGLIDNNILAIHCAANGDVWVGTDFGVSVYDGVSWTTYTTANGLGNNQIKCIAENTTGGIWFGTNNGASLFDGTNWTNLGTAQGLPFGGVTEIEIDSDLNVWFGTGLSGLRLYNSVIYSTITDANGLVDNRIRAIAIDFQKRRWIGTAEGITLLDSTNTFQNNYTKVFTLPAPDTLNPIEDIEIDSQGNIWTAVYVDYLVTEGGISVYNQSQWIQYEVNDGLVGPVVRALAIDGANTVWVATSTGVSKITNANLGINALVEKAVFSVYPNPAADEITVQFNKLLDPKEINIYNVAMQKIKSVLSDNQIVSLQVSDFPSGIYFIEIDGLTKKIVIQ